MEDCYVFLHLGVHDVAVGTVRLPRTSVIFGRDKSRTLRLELAHVPLLFVEYFQTKTHFHSAGMDSCGQTAAMYTYDVC